MPSPNCSPMNRSRLLAPPTILAAAMAMKNSMKGTESPSFSPASTLSAWRMRMGTRELVTMIWPSPASVGARMAERIPASQSDSRGKTSRAATAPRTIVSSIPALSSRAGKVPMLRSTPRSVRLASVNNSSTNPSSATLRKTSPVTPAAAIRDQCGCSIIPSAVKMIGAVRGVFAIRSERSA